MLELHYHEHILLKLCYLGVVLSLMFVIENIVMFKLVFFTENYRLSNQVVKRVVFVANLLSSLTSVTT